MHTQKIKTPDEMKPVLTKLRDEGKTIVFTNGCFDILHVGHVRYLVEARGLGDILIVGVNTDSSVKMNKGDLRPIVPEDDRAELLAALETVDYVVKFSEKTPSELIGKLQPHIHVKGGDYTEDQMPEAKVIRSYGGAIVTIPLVKGKATTNIIETILKRVKNQGQPPLLR